MGSIEDIRKQQQAARREQNPTAKKPDEGPTIKEILASKEKSELFGFYLDQDNETDLGIRLKRGDTFDEEELKDLERRRADFVNALDQAKNVGEALDSIPMDEIVALSPGLKKFQAIGGPDAIRNAIIRSLPRVAITDRERFLNLNEKITAWNETQKTVAAQNEEIKKVCKKYRITEGEFTKTMSEDNYDELYTLIRSRMSFFKKMWNTKSRLAGKADLHKGSAIKAYIAKIDSDLGNIGGVLALSLTENKTLNAAFMAEVTGQKNEKPERGTSFTEFKKPGEDEKDGVKDDWEIFRLDWKQKYGYDPENASPEKFDTAYYTFKANQISKAGLRETNTFWGWVNLKILGGFIDSIIKTKRPTSAPKHTPPPAPKPASAPGPTPGKPIPGKPTP